MCIIIAKPAGIALPPEETLKHCAEKNKDGIGIAYTFNGMVKIKKDFNDLEAFKSFLNKNITDRDACLIHFRIATTGKVNVSNCHPFPLTSRRKRLTAPESTTDIAVAHNGTFDDLKGHKKYSDTLLFIRNILSDSIIRNNLHSTAIQELINGYIDNSKLAIMNRMGDILRFGTFYPHEGLFYSNAGYKPYEVTEYRHYGPTRREKCMECHIESAWKDVEWSYIAQGFVCRECRDAKTNRAQITSNCSN